MAKGDSTMLGKRVRRSKRIGISFGDQPFGKIDVHDLCFFINLENELVNNRDENLTASSADHEYIVGRCCEDLNYFAKVPLSAIVDAQTLKLKPIKFVFRKIL